MPARAGNPDARAQERAFVEAILRDEAAAVSGLIAGLGDSFHAAVDLLERCADSGGTVLVTGLGKSGLIGAKIAATLSSLGIPAHSVHPSEAAHGDLGRFRPTDTVICLSYSGETDEVVNLAAVLKQDGLPIVAVTAGRGGETKGQGDHEEGGPSSLERLATVALAIGVEEEAGGAAFAAPTSSTTATVALGDALALAVARRRNFTDEDFAKRHPGGALGGLLRPVTEVLRFKAGQNCPLIPQSVSVREALERAAEAGRRPGAILLVEPGSGGLTGIFTDGDLRRLILRDAAELDRPISQVMTRQPRTMPSTALVRDAVRMFRECRQDEIPVVDDGGRPLGILDVQDLIAMRLVRDS
jgi:arabinose-5-phosphate isomerase